MTNYYARWQLGTLQHSMNTRRVVLLTGPRQCGKTTLAKQMASGDVHYLTLDDMNHQEAAQDDPQSFVRHEAKTIIIDEVQRVPELLQAIKLVVDDTNRPGQYLLTGSTNIQSLPGVQESLAGRITKVRLRPLSNGEVLNSEPNFIESAFNQSFNYNCVPHNRDKLLETAFRGGYPEAIRLQNRDRRRWHRDYLESLLERDLKDIINLHKLDAMQQLIEILAAWSSKYMDISAIGSSLSINRQTLESYINALESLFLIERIPAWVKTDYSRVGKKPKIFMCDSGLMSSVLFWDIDQVRYHSDRMGKLMETFAYTELSAQIEARDGQYRMYHYRDRSAREIDFLIEREDKAILGVEVKSSSVVRRNDFTHLKWFQETLMTDKPFVGIILYSGEHALSFGKNMWAIPFAMLWPAQTQNP